MCSNCGYEQEVFEEDAIEEVEDRLHLALQVHYSQLFVTTVAQIEERR